MMINGAMISGANTIHAGVGRLNRAAHEIATQSVQPLDGMGGQSATTSRLPQKDMVEPLIEQNQALYQAQAGAVVMRAANSNMGELLNMFA